MGSILYTCFFMNERKLDLIYRRLYSHYGPRGWWPIRTRAGTPGFDTKGYHKNDFSIPQSSQDLFEIIVGAILTQNTTWTNVEKTLESMKSQSLLEPSYLHDTKTEDLASVIRSSGYYNQKAKKLKIITSFLLQGDYLNNSHSPERQDLLAVWGIGPETADSILLYGFNKPYFIIDTYTKRILRRLHYITGNESYNELQDLFIIEKNDNEAMYTVRYFNEYHALIVEHAKNFCKKKPVCDGCPISEFCGKR
ncbi:MAG: hypothetical protein JXJ04_11625 [Spirochaetales bacterium]|nr:hypothetical protein [Spirochaetales bacterium]